MRRFLFFRVVFVLSIGLLTLHTNAQSVYKQSFKFARFLDYLQSYYVDSINSEKLVEDAIVDILSELDPHSTYIPSEEVKKMREPLQGNFEGIGISFNILKDTLFVITPIAGGPSEKLGVQSGDKIILVDGENIAGIGLTNEDVFRLLRGQKGTKVTISVLRKNSKELIDFNITRDKIPIFSLDASYMINPTTGYIKLNRFAATTINEFSEAADNLVDKGAENLVLDLSGNGGGYLDAAVKLADEFLKSEELIVYTEGRSSPKYEYFSTTGGRFITGKIIVLIDEGSASASEIVSGALQDWDRAILIGRRSFGKGLVQREMLLPDESALRLTTAKYYTPSGRLIQKPFDEGIEKYHMEIYNRYTNGEMQNKDSIEFPDSLKYKTKIKERIVFGGGGIMPDIFVAYDTSSYSDYYRDIIRKGILNQFVLEYVDDNRAKIIKSYPDFINYKEKFEISDKLMSELVSYAEKQDLKKDEEGYAISYEQIKQMLKAFLARDIYGRSEFYEIYNTTIGSYNKAIEVLENWDKYYKEVYE